ncbi:putative nucleic acid-binding protein [Rhizobium sp. SG_E_25_P2]|uniref:type II toxin-antitoxin system VapC family toxin n=1 Tax=Rhizobium sp. SG_E_25_P2 TaxID=2879942 RepID=UPI002475F301|nr:type II toxin-antitoxin system VapC family toxin [Rhizobium sp. SG_E_25_P2]MDH6268361.1 putative nucleic acid-binding protein [Rhizobium sp. SG_E_25_P2]
MILLDTNVISDLVSINPDPGVLAWVGSHPADDQFISAITVAEILYGIRILPEGRRRTMLESEIGLLLRDAFADRIFPFDAAAGECFATIMADRRSRGRPISQFDGQIAAIALSRGAKLVTRNVRDFELTGIEVINPWRGA